MRTGDVDILIVPGRSNAGSDHWQSRWERNLKTARRIEPDDWNAPDKDRWVGRVLEAVATSARAVVLVGHSLGVATIVHAARKLPRGSVAGAFLVAPADVDNMDAWPRDDNESLAAAIRRFGPVPLAPLAFPSRLIASSSDPYCSPDRAEQLGAAWGSHVSVIANAGHIDDQSGHGPWPEGLLTFGVFLRQLG
ncbi:MAG TPA: alpha/beta hydrolase [Hyphomicrobiaceae bacterium]|nr:alpha/beta hydrolase [Hyphomicrobiaceae bacterium]